MGEAEIDTLSANLEATHVSVRMAGSGPRDKGSKVVGAKQSSSGRGCHNEQQSPPGTRYGSHEADTLTERVVEYSGRIRKQTDSGAGVNKRTRMTPTLGTPSSNNNLERTTSTECPASSAFCCRASAFGECENYCGSIGRGEGMGGVSEQSGSTDGRSMDEQQAHSIGRLGGTADELVSTGMTEEGASFSLLHDSKIRQPQAVSTSEDSTWVSSVDRNCKRKEEEITNEHRKLLVLLHHVYTCNKADGGCPVTGCPILKRMWGHARVCDGKACNEAVSF